MVREKNRGPGEATIGGRRGLERPGEGEGGFVILDGTSCGAARLAPDDGSSWICNCELFLSSECHSGTWFMSSGNNPNIPAFTYVDFPTSKAGRGGEKAETGHEARTRGRARPAQSDAL